MSQLMIDTIILLTFFGVWAVACHVHESWTDPRNRRRRHRKARHKKRMKDLEKRGRLLR